MKYFLLLILFSCTDTVPPPVVIPPRESIFITTEPASYLPKVLECAEKIIKSELFLSKIKEIPKHTKNQLSDEELVIFFKTLQPITVKFYYPKWVFSKVLGYVNHGESTIYLNVRKYPMEFKDMVGNISHESSHTNFGYTHQGLSKEKDLSYIIGNIARDLVSEICK